MLKSYTGIMIFWGFLLIFYLKIRVVMNLLCIFFCNNKADYSVRRQQFNSKVLGLDVLHYVDADSSLNAGFIFFISLWLKFCTSIIICLCIVVGLQSEKVLLTNPSY